MAEALDQKKVLEDRLGFRVSVIEEFVQTIATYVSCLVPADIIRKYMNIV